MITIFHNPRCSKSCAAMTYLKEKGEELNVVNYLDGSVTEEQLRDVLRKLGVPAKSIVRTGEALWKERFAGPKLSEDELIRVMVENPRLIERPIVIKGDKVEVSSPQVASPVAVRYGWDKFFRVNLYNREGLPATPFRTDNWKL